MDQKKLKEAKDNMLVGGCALLFAAGYVLETVHFKTGNKNLISVTVFPRLIGALIALCASVMLIRGWRMYRSLPAEQRKQGERFKLHAETQRVYEVLGVLLGASAVMKTLGFILTMACTMFLLFILLERPEKRNYKAFLGMSLTAPILVYFAFYYCFSSLLPMGILQPVLAKIL